MIEIAGASLLLFPPHGSDFNLIENALSKAKACLQSCRAALVAVRLCRREAAPRASVSYSPHAQSVSMSEYGSCA
jgi:hypothetical protein